MPKTICPVRIFDECDHTIYSLNKLIKILVDSEDTELINLGLRAAEIQVLFQYFVTALEIELEPPED